MNPRLLTILTTVFATAPTGAVTITPTPTTLPDTASFLSRTFETNVTFQSNLTGGSANYSETSTYDGSSPGYNWVTSALTSGTHPGIAKVYYAQCTYNLGNIHRTVTDPRGLAPRIDPRGQYLYYNYYDYTEYMNNLPPGNTFDGIVAPLATVYIPVPPATSQYTDWGLPRAWEPATITCPFEYVARTNASNVYNKEIELGRGSITMIYYVNLVSYADARFSPDSVNTAGDWSSVLQIDVNYHSRTSFVFEGDYAGSIYISDDNGTVYPILKTDTITIDPPPVDDASGFSRVRYSVNVSGATPNAGTQTLRVTVTSSAI